MSVLTEYRARRAQAFSSEVIDCSLCGDAVLLHPLEVIFHLVVHGLPLERLLGSATNTNWQSVNCIACFDRKRLRRFDMVGLLRHLKQCPMRTRLFSKGAYPLCLYEHAVTQCGPVNPADVQPPRVAEKDELAGIVYSVVHVPGWCKGEVVGHDVWLEHAYARCECAAELKLSLCEFPRVVLDEEDALKACGAEIRVGRCVDEVVDEVDDLDEGQHDEDMEEDEDAEEEDDEEERDCMDEEVVVKVEPVDESGDEAGSSPNHVSEWFIPLRFIAEVTDGPGRYLGAAM